MPDSGFVKIGKGGSGFVKMGGRGGIRIHRRKFLR